MHGSHHVIDELHDCTVARSPEVCYLNTDLFEDRTDAFERCGIATYQQLQRGIRSRALAAHDWRIEQLAALLTRQRCQFAYPLRRQCATFDQHRTCFGTSQRAVFASPHGPRCLIVTDHADDY